ncbi:hypothetical protein ACFCYX_06150 [Streptomyces populi]|nr:hypothetical protein [Streptomyces populi]
MTNATTTDPYEVTMAESCSREGTTAPAAFSLSVRDLRVAPVAARPERSAPAARRIRASVAPCATTSERPSALAARVLHDIEERLAPRQPVPT